MAKKIKIKAKKPQDLEAAFQYYQSGKFQQAAMMCRKTVEENPKHSDAWYLLGMIVRKCGQNNTAINYISRAVHLNPDKPSYYYDIGLSFFFEGDMDKAMRNFSKAVDLKPDYADAHFQTGFILQQQNRLEEATKSYEQAIMFQPDNAEAHNNIGLIFLNKGNIETAITGFKRALTLEPDYAEAYYNLGKALWEKGLLDEAMENYRKALKLKPDYADAYNNLGLALTDKGMVDEAIENFKKALELAPDFAKAFNNLGVALADKCMIDEAIENYNKALMLKPEFAEAYINLGNAFTDKGRTDDAIENYKRSLDLNPDNANTLMSLGMAYLLAKDFERGWQEYEWRLKTDDVIPLKRSKWDGSPLDGKIILVYSEQGYGDILQFARYLPKLYEDFRAKKVLFVPRKGLEHLLRGSDLTAEILDAETSVETLEYDTNIHLLSLPGIFKTDLENIPFRQKRYLKANPEKVREYRDKYFNSSPCTGRYRASLVTHHSSLIKVGIFWHGSPLFTYNMKKATTLSFFYPLCRLPDVNVYSLQKGDGLEQLDNLPKDIEVINLGETFNDFSDTASAIENLDLVITIDTAVAHLSGALGKKTWILLPPYADWRWPLDIDNSPWYEDVRLFRHKEPGNKDWEEMMERVIEQVKIEVKGRQRKRQVQGIRTG